MTDPVTQLMTAHLDGLIPPDEADRLADAIVEDESAADAAAVMMMLELHLHDCYQSRQQARAVTHELRQQRRTQSQHAGRRRLLPIGAMALAAALAAVFISVGLYMMAGTDPTPDAAPQANHPPVALLTDTDGARFGQSPAPMKLGQDLPAGPVTLDAGRAQMMLRSGAVVDLVGPCEVQLLGDNRVELTRGSLLVEVPEQAVGFTVMTPRGLSIVDLGTRFYVEVTEHGTQVDTLEGAVELLRDDQPIATLNAGEHRYITETDQPPIVIEETFDGEALDVNLTWVDPSRWRLADGAAHYAGPTDSRSYLRSTRGDLIDRDFDLEASVSVVRDPNVATGESDDTISNRIYIGLGDATPSSFFEEVRLGGSLTIVTDTGEMLWQHNKPEIDQPAVKTLKPGGEQAAYGDYRLRMIKRARRVRFEVQHGETIEHFGPFDLAADDIPFTADQSFAYLGLGRFGVRSNVQTVRLTVYPAGSESMR